MNKKLIYFVIAGLMLFSGCNKDDDENESDDTTISDKEIVVKINVDGDGWIAFELDGNWVKKEIIYHNDPYTLYLTDLCKIPFPKDLTVDWGDGSETNSTKHEYKTGGTHQITLKCKELRSLYIDGKVTGIDLSKAVDLECLCFYGGRYEYNLKTLDVSRNKKLKLLDYSDTQVPFVDVSNNTKLMFLNCSDEFYEDEYKNLDFSKNTELRYLNCYWRGVESLNIKGCKELIYVNVSECGLSDEAANKIYNDLPQGKTWKNEKDYSDNQYSSYITIGYYDRYGDQQWHDTGDISIAKRKGWTTHISY